jgi:glycosyltransferase involved in cell wall biosynthesis
MPAATQRGGAEMALLHLLRELPLQSAEIAVAFLEDGPMTTATRAAGAATYVLNAGHLRQIGRYTGTVLKLRSIIKIERPNIVFSWMPKGHLYAAPAARMCGVPVLWFQMGFPVKHNPSLIDRALYAMPTDGVISCGSRGTELQREVTPRVPVRCVNLAVDVEKFNSNVLPSPSAARAELGLPSVGPIVGIVARLERWKGVHTLINAAPQVLKERPDVTFVVVGGAHPFDPGYSVELHAQIERLGLQADVVMAGAQTNVATWMQAMDIFIHASNAEPFGIVIVEAMALGKPVIAGSVGGPTDIITDRVNGLLVDFEDSATLAARILEVLGDDVLRQQLAAAATARAREFSTSIFARRLVEALAELTGNNEWTGEMHDLKIDDDVETVMRTRERT